MVYKAYAAEHGEDVESLVTGTAHEVYEKVLEVLGAYLITEDAKTKLYAYFPVRTASVI